jgi:DNA-binding beta-propeller fold protein YncE
MSIFRLAATNYNSSAWDVSRAEFFQSISVASRETSPTDLFFKPDGTKMYIIGSDSDRIIEYNLSVPWNISTAVFSQNLSVAVETGPAGLFFKSDGTIVYFVGTTQERVYGGNLNTPWDISSGSSSSSLDISSVSSSPQGLFFKPDGTKMYVANGGDGSTVSINEFNLNPAWAVATAVYNQTLPLTLPDFFTAPTGVFFKPDGLKMYVSTSFQTHIREYNLATPWDISTAVYSQLFDPPADLGNPTGVFFAPDGLVMYLVGTGDLVAQFNLR